MAKFMSLMLLFVLAISWSQGSASLVKRAIAKQSTEGVLDEDEFGEEFVKVLFAELLLLGAKPEEEPILQQRFEEASKLKFDSIEGYEKKLFEIFKEVTGRKFSLDDSAFSGRGSSESIDELDVDSPLAGPRAIQV